MMSQANYSVLCKCSYLRAIEEKSLKALLPEGYNYALCDFDGKSDQEFSCRFRINIDSKESIKQWLEEFTISSHTSYRISTTYPENTTNIIYKVRMHCHHNTRPSSHKVKNPRAKHTNCPAQLNLTIKQKHFSRNYKSRDFHLPEMPTIVILKHQHNHRMEAADVLKFRSPHPYVKDEFFKMFRKSSSFRKTPLKARDKCKKELQEDHGSNYFIVSADRARYPAIKCPGNSKEQTSIVLTERDDEVESSKEFGNLSKNINSAHKDNTDENILKKFESVTHEISEKAVGNPDILNAIQKYVKSYENIHTEADLVSALNSFGKFTGFAERKRLASSNKIDFQTTVVARRETASGKTSVQTGRPPKRSYADEHLYNIKKVKSTIMPTKTAKLKAPILFLAPK